jgi:methyl-accepting chemotaxis protein
MAVALGVGCLLLVDPAGSSAWKGQNLAGQAVAFWPTLNWRIAFGILLIISAAGGLLYHLYRMIALPLEKAAEAAGRMAEGNLSETIAASACDEIDRIGEGVNSLSVNFQEALILVWNQTENAIARIRRTAHQLEPEEKVCNMVEMKADLDSARRDLEMMQMMVRSFDLYDVTINESDLLTAKDKAEALN